MAVKTKPKGAKRPAPKKSKPAGVPQPRPAPKSPPKRIRPAKPKAAPAKPADPAAIDYASPAYLAAYDAETARTSSEQVQEIYRLKAEWEAAHEKAAGLKKEFEAHRTEHLQYVRERIDKRGKNPGHLFAEVEARETIAAAASVNGKGKPRGKKAEAGGAGAGELVAPPGSDAKGADWFPDNLWQQYPLDRLKPYGLTDSDLKALDACEVPKAKGETFAPIDTLGAMSRFQQPKGNGFAWRLTDVKGVGPAAAERIANATTTFWSDWPNLQQPFAVERGYRRPDPLAEATNEDHPGVDPDPGDAGDGNKDQPASPGDGGDPHAVPNPDDAGGQEG